MASDESSAATSQWRSALVLTFFSPKSPFAALFWGFALLIGYSLIQGLIP